MAKTLAIVADWLNPTLTEMVALLRDRGVAVEVIFAREGGLALDEVRAEHDLYLLKASSPMGLALAGLLHAAGARCLNPYPAVALLRDKLLTTRALADAGLPVPESFACQHPAMLAPLLAGGPLIVKPREGSRGRGIHIVERPGDLADLPGGDFVFAQRLHRPDGRDRKIFRVGDELFGVLRRFPLRDYSEKLGEPFTLDARLTDIAMGVGEALGIAFYSLDVVLSRGQPYVVDVNKFGSYVGVPAGARRLADYFAGELAGG